MAKHNYTFRFEGQLDPKQVGENIDKIFPGFYTKAKQFFSTKEGMEEYVDWLRNIPEDSLFAKYKVELPEAEARLKAMEVA